MEPKKKKRKTEDELKEMICSIQDIFFNKLKNIEEKIEKINSKYINLEKKVENIICNIQGVSASCSNSSLNNPTSEANIESQDSDDYPDGSWLGDPNNPDFRVRCSISPQDLDNINNSCTTPEKMSLTLLDHLFSREEQACSNLSGVGKHGKKQLDPNKIHGIKCHVTYMFHINENDWRRLKLNIDSKCRTAFRRKLKGKPLDIRGAKVRSIYRIKKKHEDPAENLLKEMSEHSNPENEVLEISTSKVIEKTTLNHGLPIKVQTLNLELESNTEENSMLHSVLPVNIETINSIASPLLSKSEIIHSAHGDIQVIRVSNEQFELFKQSHNIEVLSQPV